MKSAGSILYLVNSLEMDAPSRLTAALAVGMLHHGWRVTYIAWSRGGALKETLTQSGVRVEVLGKSMIVNALKLRDLIDEIKPDILHTALVRPTLGIALARVLGMQKSFVWVAGDHGVHEWHEQGRVAGFMMDRIMPVVFSQADRVVTVSQSSLSLLMSYGVQRYWTSVVPNGVDVRKYYPGPQGHRNDVIHTNFPDADISNTFLIGMAGNLRWLKGHDVFLRALAIIVQSEPSVRLILWGTGLEQLNLQKLSDELGIRSRVSFAGWDGELASKLPVLDLFVQPSRTESFGLAAAEAMACGVPTFVSDAGGLPELMGDMAETQVFHSEDTHELAAKIVGCLSARRRRKMLGKAARLRVLQSYTEKGMVRAMQDVYDKLMDKAR